MNYHALCFVDMPFGQKPDLKSGVVVDFDQIYNEAIKPAIEECGLQALRGDEERTGGIIHSAMFARLLLAEFVVADLTLVNANVFYELGIRHAARPCTTVPIFANVSALPFDVALVRAVGYQLKKGKLTKAAAQKLKSQLAKRFCEAMSGAPTDDSPLFQLIPKFPGIDLPDDVTETFKDRIRQAEEFREILSAARAKPPRERRDALLKIRSDLGDLKTVRRAVLIELMSSFRDAEAFAELVELYDGFPAPVKEYVIVKQQFALALNRRNQSDDREKALKILDELLKDRGPDSETLGIKGRIRKDTYKEAVRTGRITAAAALDDAIDVYTKGFEADPRDYYPGVNAINLLMQKDDTEALKEVARLLPLVSFAVERRGGASSGNYWDLATVLELACLGDDWATANRVLPKVILAATNSFETATTLGNLRLLKQARERTAREVAKLDGILDELSVRDTELRGEEKKQASPHRKPF
jgi:tetratricopeptide (TPR) repeat protein